MTTTTATTATFGTTRKYSQSTAFHRRVWARVARWHDRRCAVQQLKAMDDHELRDLGIDRDQIRTVVYGMAA